MIGGNNYKNSILFGFVSSVLIIAVILATNIISKQTKVVFCDVGQGDGAYIRIKNKIDIVIDAGRDKKILSCLGKYMPFYDRDIEIAFLSHPQYDHFGGYLHIVDRYKIENFFMPNVDNPIPSFQALKEKLKRKGVSIHFANNKTQINILKDKIFFLWPTKQFVKLNTHEDYYKGLNLNNTKLDLNYFSLVFQLQEGRNKVMFTGDAPPEVLNKIIKLYKYNSDYYIKTSVLKVPHHGSKNGLNIAFLRLADPILSVISVGKNNHYGHPSKEVLDLFDNLNKTYKRTDKQGDIVIKFP